MNAEVVKRYMKDKPLISVSKNGNVEEYGKPNIELLVKRLLKSKYIVGQ